MKNIFFTPEEATFMLGEKELGTLYVNMDEDGEYVYSLKLRTDTPSSDIPWAFKGLDNKFVPLGSGELHHTLIKGWVEERIFPPDRFNAEELLKELKMSEYDEWKILKATRAFSFHDNYWIKINKEDKKPNLK